MSKYRLDTDHPGAQRLRDLADESADLDMEFPGAQAALEAKFSCVLIELGWSEEQVHAYLAEPLPRPPIEVTVPDFSRCKFTVSVGDKVLA
jgi:hypothetical protein